MRIAKLVLVSIAVVIVNILIGHFFAPNGIMLTPIVLIIVSILVGIIDSKLKSIGKSAIIAGLIGLHDIGIKLFSGGRHDLEGLGWVHLMLFIGLVPAFGILIGGIIKTKEDSAKNKWIAIIAFPIIIWIHHLLFERLGLGRHYRYEWNG